MARSIWNGTISFGLVSVPVKAFAATAPKAVRFHEVHVKDGARIVHRRVCPAEGQEVPYDEIVKGWEVAPDEYVILDKEEIKAAAGVRTKRIDLEDFVELGQIDPVFYERTYYLGNRGQAVDAYRLLHEAMRRTERAGIGRWTFHDREYLVAIRALEDVLALHTMRFHDEIVRGQELHLPTAEREPSQRELQMALQLVESLHEPFKPERYADTYRDAVLDLIRRKAAGEEIAVPIDAQPEEEPDLASALEATLQGAR